LRGIPEGVLPLEIIEEEIGILTQIGVETKPATAMNGGEWLEAIITDFDAVYVGLEPGSPPDSGILSEGCMPADPLTLATSRAGLFVGGKGTKEAACSPIESVAEGRRAAVSIDRFLQKVSLVARREKEGPYETKLFTSLDHVTPQPEVRMKDPSGYSETEAMDEAKRCLQCECMECVKICPYLEHFESYPKRYVRQISADATMVMGSHGKTSKLVNSCSLCGLCTLVCPHELSMADVCMEGRRSLVRRNKMPPSAHAFALEDMGFSNSEKAALALHEPGKDQSQFVFFPGCQLAAIYPEHVLSAYTFLRNNLKDVGFMLRCCGVPGKWAARGDLFEEALRGMEEAWKSLGSPTIIMACPTCYQILKERLPQANMVTLWQILVDAPQSNQAKAVTRKLAIHDPCATRYEPDIQDAVRKIVTGLGYDIEELTLGRDRTECCGFGGLMSAANPSLARDVAKTRALRSETDYVTYCAMCRNALAATGKRVLYLLDLLFASETDAANRRAPGLSERRENRYRLKQRLLKELWGKQEGKLDDYEKITLYISPAVHKLMEERRILTEDVQKVIDHAEKSGMKLFNPDLVHWLASFKPAHVTYWVEYSPEGNGFMVHNTYCHRMEIVEETGA
jgi:Fe-S oxidoreductase